MWQLGLSTDRSEDSDQIISVSPTGQQQQSSYPATEKSTLWWHLSTSPDHDVFAIHLKVNGRELDRITIAPGKHLFRWETGFNAGFVDVDLAGVQPRAKPVRVTVDPDARKITQAHFQRMISDIVKDTKSLTASAGFRVSTARGTIALPIAKVEYILAQVQEIYDLAVQLDRSHRLHLIRETRGSRIDQARRIDGRQWNVGLRRSTVVQKRRLSNLPIPMQALIGASGGRVPFTVQETRAVAENDRREHAEILGWLEWLSNHLRNVNLRQRLLGEDARDRVLMARCTSARRQLAQASSLSVFYGVKPIKGNWSASRLYESLEPYKSLRRKYLELRLGINGAEGDFGKIPLQETFRLYETWVALRFAAAALTLDPAAEARLSLEDRMNHDGLTFRLQQAEIAFLGCTFSVKPTFDRVWATNADIGSISRDLIPDMSIRFDGPVRRPRLIVLDTKYRVGAQLNDAVGSLHIYRDALVSSAERDYKVVEAGYLITPMADRMKDSQGELVERLFTASYQRDFNLGAISLLPGVELHVVGTTLKQLVDRYSNAASRDAR